MIPLPFLGIAKLWKTTIMINSQEIKNISTPFRITTWNIQSLKISIDSTEFKDILQSFNTIWLIEIGAISEYYKTYCKMNLKFQDNRDQFSKSPRIPSDALVLKLIQNWKIIPQNIFLFCLHQIFPLICFLLLSFSPIFHHMTILMIKSFLTTVWKIDQL